MTRLARLARPHQLARPDWVTVLLASHTNIPVMLAHPALLAALFTMLGQAHALLMGLETAGVELDPRAWLVRYAIARFILETGETFDVSEAVDKLMEHLSQNLVSQAKQSAEPTAATSQSVDQARATRMHVSTHLYACACMYVCTCMYSPARGPRGRTRSPALRWGCPRADTSSCCS